MPKPSSVWTLPAKGQFLVSVFNSQAGWLKQSRVQDVVAVTSDGFGRAALDVTPGSYGIAIIHDANGDGKINTIALGIPTEAFGFSNNAKAGFGPPGFRRAALMLPRRVRRSQSTAKLRHRETISAIRNVIAPKPLYHAIV
ncbi:MAG: DUF2141 domain-containing protein [Paracoccaceae bacterium]